MKMVVQFDCDADIIDVPEFVVEQRDRMRSRFWKWLSDKRIKHKYWITVTDRSGKKYSALRYRSDAFVEWLNKKVLKDSDHKAYIVEEHIWDYPNDIPSIFF